MKTCTYADIICRGFCHFHKEDRAELACGSYNFLTEILTRRELELTIHGIPRVPDFSRDEEVKVLICENCDFLIDGCDFREGVDAPPCGGYAIIEWMIKRRNNRGLNK